MARTGQFAACVTAVTALLVLGCYALGASSQAGMDASDVEGMSLEELDSQLQ
ncbi:hypothetical protein E4U55_002011, partial [Claviceps digitariae]